MNLARYIYIFVIQIKSHLLDIIAKQIYFIIGRTFFKMLEGRDIFISEKKKLGLGVRSIQHVRVRGGRTWGELWML